MRPSSREDSPLWGGSRWNTCLTLAVCPLPGTARSPPVSPRGAGPLAPQGEAPLRGSCGVMGMEHSEFGEQQSGTGARAWGRGGLVVLVLGTVLEDAGELHVVEVAFLINGGLSVHLVHFLICEAVAHGGEQLPKVVLMDKT